MFLIWTGCCLFRDFCCTRKLPETHTWSRRMALLGLPPTWTALKGVSPSLNWPKGRNKKARSQRSKMIWKPRMFSDLTCRQTQINNYVSSVRITRWKLHHTKYGELWGWTWWSLRSVNLLLLCWAGPDPRWSLTPDLCPLSKIYCLLLFPCFSMLYCLMFLLSVQLFERELRRWAGHEKNMSLSSHALFDNTQVNRKKKNKAFFFVVLAIRESIFKIYFISFAHCWSREQKCSWGTVEARQYSEH